MTRTKGAQDRKPRRERSDKGRKRKKYRGRPVSKSRKIKYEKKKGQKEILKIWIWQRAPMSKEGYKRWNKKMRPYIKPYIFLFHVRADVPVERLRNKREIEDLMLEIVGHEGDFYMMGFSKTPRNKYRVKPVKMARILILESREGLKARMVENFRLWRYWFWEG